MGQTSRRIEPTGYGYVYGSDYYEQAVTCESAALARGFRFAGCRYEGPVANFLDRPTAYGILKGMRPTDGLFIARWECAFTSAEECLSLIEYMKYKPLHLFILDTPDIRVGADDADLRKAASKARRKAGWDHSRAFIGWRKDKNGEYKPFPEQRRAAMKIWELHEGGLTLSDIGQQVALTGIWPWRKSMDTVWLSSVLKACRERFPGPGGQRIESVEGQGW